MKSLQVEPFLQNSLQNHKLIFQDKPQVLGLIQLPLKYTDGPTIFFQNNT